MGSQFINSVVTVLLAIVGVAIIAVLVSKNANTTGVVSATGNAFSQGLSTAISPVTGNNNSLGNGFPGGGGGAIESY